MYLDFFLMRLFIFTALVIAWSGFSWGQCPATFTATTISCNEVQFTPDSDNAASYIWNFGDGESSTEENPTHIFFVDTPGNTFFNVTLITGGGCIADTVISQITVSTSTLPDASIESENTFDQFIRCTPNASNPAFTLEINNISTTSPANNFYIIDWGDGSEFYESSTLPNGSSHLYAEIGLFNIELRVRSSNGCWSRSFFPFFNGNNPGGNVVPPPSQIACIPEELIFAIDGTEDNPSGTIYRLWFNDGSADTIIFNHPPPETFSHNFTTTPCDSSLSTESTFRVFFEAINPCFTQEGNATVTANKPPEVDFIISPETGCQNSIFNILNESIPATYIVSNTCTSQMETTWSISPGTNSDWNIAAGSLTDENGFDISFNTPGEYQITLNYRTEFDSGCEAPPLTKTICVLPIPDSEFTPTEESGCTNADNPLIIDFNNESNTLDACGPTATYTWSVGFTPGECGSPAAPTQLDRTPLNLFDTPTLNDQDIRLRFDSAGIYTVYLTVSNECGVNTDSTIVTVSGAPLIEIVSIPDSCFTGTFVVTPTLSFDADCFSVPMYEWEFPGGSPDSHTGEFPPAITYDSPDEYIIRLRVENECGETPVLERFTLFEPPSIPNIQVTEEVCVGGIIAATNPPPPDPTTNTYRWTGPNGFTHSSDTWEINPATAAAAGTYVLTVIDGNGCTNTETFVVAVTLSAPIQIIPDPAVVCVGEDITLTASGGVTYSWEGNHLDGDSGGSVVFSHDVVGEFEVVVIGADPAGACDGSDTILVSVVAAPIVDAGEPRLSCVGVDFDFQPEASPALTGGATGSWSGDHIGPAGIFNVDAPGNYTVTYNFTDANGCSGSDEATICVRERPIADFLLIETSFCLTDSPTLRPENTSNTLGDCAAATYNWEVTFVSSECSSGTSAPTFVEGTNANSVDPVIRFTESGEYTLTLTVSSDCGTDMTSETVTIGDAPTVTIADITDKCGAQPVNFTANVSDCNAGATTYSWTFPTATPPATADIAAPAPVPFAVGMHTVTLTVTNNCGTNSTITEFEVLEGPVIDISLPRDSVCAGEQLAVMGNSSGTSLIFSWAASDPAISFSDLGIETPMIDFTGVPVGPHTITVTVGNAVCDPVMTNFLVFVNDLPTVTLEAIENGCGNISFTPTYDFGIPLENIDDILWELSDGTITETISTEADPGVVTIDAPGNYTLTLTAINSCGTSSMSQVFQVLERPLVDVSVDTTFVCRGGSVLVTNNSTGDNLNFNWSASPAGGVTISDQTARNPTITFNGVAGNYVITATIGNDLCNRLTYTQIIEVGDVPVLTIAPIPNGCGQANITPQVTYGLTDNLIDSVQWEIRRTMGEDAGAVIYSGEAVNTPLDVVGAGTYSFTATAFNRCAPTGTAATVMFRLYESPTGSYAINEALLCRRDGSVSLTSNFTGDIDTYNWTVTETATNQEITSLSSTEENPTFVFGPGLSLGDYTIAVSLGNAECAGVPWDTIISLNAEPMSILLEDIEDSCDNITFNPTANYGEFTTGFIDSVRWTFPTGSIPATSTELDPGPVTLSTTGLGLEVRLDVFNRCGMAEESVTFNLLVGPTLDVATDTAFVCRGDTITILNNSAGDNLVYRWEASPATGVTFSDTEGRAPSITFDGPVGDYVISAEIGNPVCGTLSWDTIIRLSELPTVTITDVPDFCGPSLVTFTGVFSDEAFIDSVRWQVMDESGAQLFSTDSLAPAAAPLSEGSYTVIATVFNECGSSEDQKTFRILEPIVVEASIDTNFSCSLPFLATVTNATVGGDLNYDWSITGPFADNVTFDPGARDPVFTILDTGVYVISQRVFNAACGDQFWRDTVTVLASPLPILTDLTEFCEEVNLTPLVDYGSYRIDSVVWNFTGSTLMPPISREMFPTDIPYRGAGTYTYSVTAYNACGSIPIEDSFTVDTIPMISLGPADTVCITDGNFMVPPATLTGGVWRDSLGRPGVITEAGLFDPVIAMGGVTIIEYVYTIGDCEVITSKNIFVVDLSALAVEPAVLNPCVTESAFTLDNGTPRPGWYTGPGVTDTLGVFDATSVGIGDFTLTYHYQAPGTDCIETRDFTVSVRPPPLPSIGITDSVCVNIPTDILHTGSGSVAWNWILEDGTTFSTEDIVYTFPDTGSQTIRLAATSEFGCVDSLRQDIYVSGPPVSRFTKDTTMGCALLPVNFTNQSIGFEFVRYGWDFGNGDLSSLAAPGTVFYDQGDMDTTYYINLVVTNACGVDNYLDSVTVFPSPKAFLDLSQDEGCTPLYVEFLNITRGQPDRYEWYIDGVPYSTDSIAPDRSFLAPDSMTVFYEVMLIAFNECGSDTTRRTITVLPDNVRAFFSVEDQVGCDPFDVQFRNFSDPDTLVTFDWFFGDGSTSQLKNPLHTFRNSGDTSVVYEVTLVADNGCGQDSIMIPITVNPAPQVSFTAPPVTCARDTVFFINTSEEVTNPVWVFGDGDTLTMTEDPGHVFSRPGDYTVELTAFAVGTGCPATWTEIINIRPIPVANATAGPLFGCPPLTVDVSNLSVNADFYFWDYGDGNTSVGPSPGPHIYTTPGFYDISLTARDEFGCAHDSVVATVQVYEVPVVSFETEQDQQCGVPTEICFENNTVTGGDYQWNFGNGQTSTENNPCVTYDTPGDYVVNLLATNTFLCETRAEIPFTVYGTPVADFSIPDSTVCEVATVTFTNTSREAEFAEWVFSDGYVSDEFNVTRTFTEVGRYGFILIVGNGSGCRDTLVTGDFLDVHPSPMADFDFFDLPDEPPTTIEFTDLSSSDAILYGWDFDDGFVSDEMNPVHRYLSSFDKTVTHWVENEFGCADTISMVVDLDTLGALYIPNVFTPGDASIAEKDIFKPKGIGLENYYIAVYSRNGQILWESDAVDEEGIPTDAWDGNFQGQPMPAGTYVWRVHRASYFNGRPWRGMEDERGVMRVTGYVTLVR
jgi:PKD repeat protein